MGPHVVPVSGVPRGGAVAAAAPPSPPHPTAETPRATDPIRRTDVRSPDGGAQRRRGRGGGGSTEGRERRVGDESAVRPVSPSQGRLGPTPTDRVASSNDASLQRTVIGEGFPPIPDHRCPAATARPRRFRGGIPPDRRFIRLPRDTSHPHHASEPPPPLSRWCPSGHGPGGEGPADTSPGPWLLAAPGHAAPPRHPRRPPGAPPPHSPSGRSAHVL